ncbi:hypothetical protein EDD86DRAFT_209816, partial [Gorgonomyces haynaldii]
MRGGRRRLSRDKCWHLRSRAHPIVKTRVEGCGFGQVPRRSNTPIFKSLIKGLGSVHVAWLHGFPFFKAMIEGISLNQWALEWRWCMYRNLHLFWLSSQYNLIWLSSQYNLFSLSNMWFLFDFHLCRCHRERLRGHGSGTALLPEFKILGAVLRLRRSVEQDRMQRIINVHGFVFDHWLRQSGLRSIYIIQERHNHREIVELHRSSALGLDL